MANEEHLVILRQGVEAWNRWREERQDIKPDLDQATLEGANLRGVNFVGATLRNTSLSRSNLNGADLVEADLEGANLIGVSFFKAFLQDTNLSRANLRRANFFRTFLQRVRMNKAVIGETVFGDVDLQIVQGLDTMHHDGPSTIGIDTFYRSRGDIPEIFLRGCGVPDSMIEYARSLVAAKRPIDYYSVFISYSSEDTALAERLYADLQARGVRCWFAPHDLEIGVPIVRGIDEAIRIYDKLLIILSEASVTSSWVEFEVSQALHREIEQGHTMLFPIRLDDTVLHTSTSWATQLRSRHIGDFRGWKDHNRYQAVFTRLLRDLKAKDHLGTEDPRE